MYPIDFETALRNSESNKDNTNPWLWFRLFWIRVDHTEVADFFTVEAAPYSDDGLGDTSIWIVGFDCGMRLLFEFYHHGNGACVYADTPCAQHASRHLKELGFKNSTIEFAIDDMENNAKVEKFSKQRPELLETSAFQIWRQGEDGNPIAIGDSTTRRDAECWVAELESHQHKQVYWVSKI